MCKSLLLSIVVSLIGCQYQGLEEPDMYLSHDLERVCTPTISLRAKALKNNQGNGENPKRCSIVSAPGELSVAWSSDSSNDKFGSCQYHIPFDGGTQQPCKGGNTISPLRLEPVGKALPLRAYPELRCVSLSPG